MYEEIFAENVLIAQIYNLNSIEGVSFPTPTIAPFQFGYGKCENDRQLEAHIHKRVKREIMTTSEFLYVVSGEMTIDIFDEKCIRIESVILTDNMGLLQFFGGHKISLKSGTVYFELKQGPYFGRDFDKFSVLSE